MKSGGEFTPVDTSKKLLCYILNPSNHPQFTTGKREKGAKYSC
jgi:hypothetical protein